MQLKKKGRRCQGAVVVALIAVFLLDMFFWRTRASDALAMAWGSLAIGFFLQVAAIALLSQIPVIREFPKSLPDKGSLARRLVAIVVPFLVLSWIGADLVHKGMHEGGSTLNYRGQR